MVLNGPHSVQRQLKAGRVQQEHDFLPLGSLSYFLLQDLGTLHIHVHRLIFQGESKFRGFKGDKGHIEGPGEQREQQPNGPGQGVVHFFQICI